MKPADNLVLEPLRAIRADVTEMRDLQRDHCLRLTRIETEVVGLRRDQVSDAETVVHFETRLDRPRDDVERIKRRLDIQDA